VLRFAVPQRPRSTGLFSWARRALYGFVINKRVDARAPIEEITMFKAATPLAAIFSFPQLKAEFLTQVEKFPCAGQRHHKAQNAAGRKHIQIVEVPTSQGVFHAVCVKGKMASRKRKLVLIDGYHRLSHWFGADECPFPGGVIVVIHEVEADTPEQLVERIDALARTIDNKKAVKTPADRWCAAVRDAGLDAPKSKAYKVGFKANSFFKRVLKSANDSMLKLTARAQADVLVHGLMDRLFARSETEMSSANASEYFHAGVQTVLFAGLRKLPVDKHEIAVEQLETLLVKLNKANTSVSYRLAKLSPELENLYAQLVYLASPEKKKALRSIGNREDYYNAVIDELKAAVDDFCASLMAGKKRIRKAV
jgi:hypothetical protein